MRLWLIVVPKVEQDFESQTPHFQTCLQMVTHPFLLSEQLMFEQLLDRRAIRAVAPLLSGVLTLCFFATSLQGDMFVSAASANSVMRFDDAGNFLGNFVSPNSGGLSNPQGIAFGPDGHLYVASQGSNNVLRFDGQSGAPLGVFASVAGTSWPAEINFRDGMLYMSDFGISQSVYRFDATTGNLIDQFITGVPFADGQEWDANGNIYVSSGNRVRRFDPAGNFIDDFVPGGLSLALDNLFLPDGTFLVSDFNQGVVKHYDVNGNFLGNVISLPGPQGLEIGPDGHLYAGSFTAGLINRYDISTFQLLGTAANAVGTTNNFTFGPPAQIPEPGSLAFAAAMAACLTGRRMRRNS